MECDAAGANIYHIIVRGNTFHSFFFLTFTFNFMFILEGWKLWQLRFRYVMRGTLRCFVYLFIFYRDRNAKSKLITKGKTEELSRLK